ncbi:MAG: hypothetical protein GTO41_24175, partial [Burkholderiales bacterium]|nr:hypothetical protein [Burkholderiales bacterium]
MPIDQNLLYLVAAAVGVIIVVLLVVWVLKTRGPRRRAVPADDLVIHLESLQVALPSDESPQL